MRPARALQLALFARAFGGAVWESPRVHRGLAIGYLVILLRFVFLSFVPGSFVP